MLWRRVQEALPRASTSGGQSAGCCCCCWSWKFWVGCVDVVIELFDFLDMAAHAAKDVHERHL